MDGRQMPMEVAQSKQRQAAAQAELAEIQVRTRKGELVERQVVADELPLWVREERDSWQAWAARTAPLLAAELMVDVTRVIPLLDRELARQLARLAERPAAEVVR